MVHARKKSFSEVVHQLTTQFAHLRPSQVTDHSQPLIDRLRRSLSWVERAADIANEDKPPRFVDLWIGFNALYGTRHYGSEYSVGEVQDFAGFMSIFSGIPSGREALLSLMSKKYHQGRVRDLVQNKYLWNHFWSDNESEYEWESAHELKKLELAIGDQDPNRFYGSMFKRVQVLRNQIFHGSAAADTRHNKDALVLAVLLLEELLPVFIGVLIKDGHRHHWPELPYPARGTPGHPRKR